jgi:hypothetical protein
MGTHNKNFYNDYAKRLGYKNAAVKIQDLYLAGKKDEVIAAVPDALVDDVHLAGPKARSVSACRTGKPLVSAEIYRAWQ